MMMNAAQGDELLPAISGHDYVAIAADSGQSAVKADRWPALKGECTVIGRRKGSTAE